MLSIQDYTASKPFLRSASLFSMWLSSRLALTAANLGRVKLCNSGFNVECREEFGMLVLANGAFKSGSTWLREIVKRIHPFDPIPEGWQRPTLPHWIEPQKIPEFANTPECRQRDFLSKSHIFDKRLVPVLLSIENVKVLDITRDVKDSIVSHYHHLRRERRVPEDFANYYWRVGRYKAYELRLYHQMWTTGSPNVYTSSFEELKRDFRGEVRRVGLFLGDELDDDQLDRLKKETSIESLRSNTGEAEKSEKDRFFRKGEVGDWENHFGDAERVDVEEIYNNGLPTLAKIRYDLEFTLRRRLVRAMSRR